MTADLFESPQPNAALVVGPDDYLVLGFEGLDRARYDEIRLAIPEHLRSRVLIVADGEMAVLRGRQ